MSLLVMIVGPILAFALFCKLANALLARFAS